MLVLQRNALGCLLKTVATVVCSWICESWAVSRLTLQHDCFFDFSVYKFSFVSVFTTLGLFSDVTWQISLAICHLLVTGWLPVHP